MSQKRRTAWIYIIEADSVGLVKIGLTKRTTPSERLSEIQRMSPVKLRLAFSFHVEDTNADLRRLEKYIHGKLINYRRHGEWFAVSVDVATECIETAYMQRAC